jgi:hypothetical protein
MDPSDGLPGVALARLDVAGEGAGRERAAVPQSATVGSRAGLRGRGKQEKDRTDRRRHSFDCRV